MSSGSLVRRITSRECYRSRSSMDGTPGGAYPRGSRTSVNPSASRHTTRPSHAIIVGDAVRVILLIHSRAGAPSFYPIESR